VQAGVPTGWSGGLPSAPEGCWVPGEDYCVARLTQIAAWIIRRARNARRYGNAVNLHNPCRGRCPQRPGSLICRQHFLFPRHGTMRASSPTKCGSYPKTQINHRHPAPNTPRTHCHNRNSRRWRCESPPDLLYQQLTATAAQK
jgi:hypothetical protein